MILNLILKGKWYDMIESGRKIEEYREIKPYWIKRLCDGSYTYDRCATCNGERCLDCLQAFKRYKYNHYDAVNFSRGYTKRKMMFEIKGMTIGKGIPEWGAPKNKLVFIIELGRRIENEKDYLRKWKGTKECENAKAWHEILLEDAEQLSRKLKEKELKNNNNHEA